MICLSKTGLPIRTDQEPKYRPEMFGEIKSSAVSMGNKLSLYHAPSFPEMGIPAGSSWSCQEKSFKGCKMCGIS